MSSKGWRDGGDGEWQTRGGQGQRRGTGGGRGDRGGRSQQQQQQGGTRGQPSHQSFPRAPDRGGGFGRGQPRDQRGYGRGGQGRGSYRAVQQWRIVTNREAELPPYRNKAPIKGSVHNQKHPEGKWKDLNPEGPNDLPLRKPPGPKNYTAETVIVVNHFEVKIRIPNPLYRYDITVERVPRVSEEQKKTKKEKEGKSSGKAGDAAERLKKLPAMLKKIVIRYVVEQLRAEYPKAGVITNFTDVLATVAELRAPFTKEVEGSQLVDVKGEQLVEEIGSRFRVTVSPNEAAPEIDTTEMNNIINDMQGKTDAPLNVTDIEAIYGMLMRNLTRDYFPMKRTYLINFLMSGSEFERIYPIPLGEGIVNYRGFSVTLPLNNGWKPFINIELANLASYMDGPVNVVIHSVLTEGERQLPHGDKPAKAEDMKTWKRGTSWAKGDWEKVNELLTTCQVKHWVKGGTYYGPKTVAGLCEKSVSQTMFDFAPEGSQKSKRISVYEYFQKYRKQERITLSYKDGPCLELRNGDFIPAELCVIKAGQSFNRRLSPKQTDAMGNVARLKPTEPEQYCGGLQPAIQQSVEKLGLMNNDLLKTYGVQLATGKMHKLNGKILAPPELFYGKKIEGQDHGKRVAVDPKDGAWDMWSTKFEFYENAKVTAWSILNLATRWPPKSDEKARTNNCMSFAQKLIDKAATRGIQMPQPTDCIEKSLRDSPDSKTFDSNVQTLHEELEWLKKGFNGAKDSFVLVVLPEKNSRLYDQVKQAAELLAKVLTQCIIAKNLSDPRRLDSIVGNILLKINSKLSCVNHVVLPPPNMKEIFTIFNYPTMIMGADVTHPPPGSGKKDPKTKTWIDPPSYAAVTGSICRTGMPYMMHIQAQKKIGKGAAEVIEGLDAVVGKFIDKYLQFTGIRPVKIIYFRDGVGDGQFQEVLQKEMSAIRAACIAIHNDYKPSITFLTVQKRHKTRFFVPLEHNKYGNAPPGTVVDRDIVHRTENDFYLLSHQAILGTSRPTRYHVLWDDSDFTMSEIQTMAYYLCYMFVRCNRSVKIPAPTYYAHWAAKRAEVLSKSWGENFYEKIPALNAKLMEREIDFAQNYPMHFV